MSWRAASRRSKIWPVAPNSGRFRCRKCRTCSARRARPVNRPMTTHRKKGTARQRKSAARLRKPAPRPARPPAPEAAGPAPFRVLIAVHRPRYRSRSERAVALPDWEVRSLLNREDPIGLINQKPPNIFIVSGDFGRNKELGFLKAAQRYRGDKMKIVGLFEAPDEAEAARDLCDAVLAPPWRTADLRALAAQFYEAQ